MHPVNDARWRANGQEGFENSEWLVRRSPLVAFNG